MTNGRYKSVEHRPVTDRCRARLSIGVFYAPEFEPEIGPAQEHIDQTHPCLLRNFIHEDYMKLIYQTHPCLFRNFIHEDYMKYYLFRNFIHEDYMKYYLWRSGGEAFIV